MSNGIDRFSDVAADYARYRPKYPESLYQFLLSLVSDRRCAWDAGTGNGQVAAVLSKTFSKVIATDISSAQLANAVQVNNLEYCVCPVENSGIEANAIDLITVAQAAHWFHMHEFADEVRRVSTQAAVLAIWGYTLFTSTPEIDAIVLHLYKHVLDGFWDPHRAFVDRRYQDFILPFYELRCPEFVMEKTWFAEDILGYLGTWSAVSRYRKAYQRDPIEEIRAALIQVMQEKSAICLTPVFMRAWRVFGNSQKPLSPG